MNYLVIFHYFDIQEHKIHHQYDGNFITNKLQNYGPPISDILFNTSKKKFSIFSYKNIIIIFCYNSCW